MKHKRKYSTLSIIGFVFAFLLPPIGATIAIIAIVKSNKDRYNNKNLAIVGTAIGIFLSIPFVIFISILMLLNPPSSWFAGNYAQKKFQPLDAELIQLGASKICDFGSNGRGNEGGEVTPYYGVYYSIDDLPELTNKIKIITEKHGFILSDDYFIKNDRRTIANKQQEYLSKFNSKESNSDKLFSESSDYLKSDNSNMSVIISRNSGVSLECPKKYRTVVNASGSRAILAFKLSYRF